ncbi:recombination protein RecR [Capsulimonas corticalis]|uniref:Recombination protein RecR n=1 Tax=Capsulimonas corticalis TaxID=2219043 RepID=A0A402D3U0_9BACT|nr:recombination mediator RecR [Capsulimonas corticalis]BDI31819.1 recombination protein RecR [Capsulimonas corticalis]
MAAYYPKPIARLVGEFEKLPGIGPKSAQRLAFHIMRIPEDETRALAEALLAIQGSIRFCSICFNYSEGDVCDICANPRRDQTHLCVVAEPRDLIAMEKTNEYKGVYHVLQGVISPLEGVTPDRLKVKELQARVADGGFKEIILAMNPTVEGDTTAMYLASILKPLGPRVSRIAHGMPVGGDLDYADQATLIQALEWRREV